MAHFAKLNENNIVTEVNVVNNEDIGNLEFPTSELLGIEFLTNWSGGHNKWRQTSYNSKFRVRYACVGDVYDEVKDAFIPPKPFDSWILNAQKCIWEPPIPYPANEGLSYSWNESKMIWEQNDSI
jgi:hypothetical protein